jgi:hypothetical protein
VDAKRELAEQARTRWQESEEQMSEGMLVRQKVGNSLFDAWRQTCKNLNNDLIVELGGYCALPGNGQAL